jgi:acetyltransferase-like isoleucine patch superfamily enzyme
LLGGARQICLASGNVLGARTRVIAGPDARVVFGAGVWLAADVEIETETGVQIGARTTIQRRCTVNGTTRIGRDCILAPNVFISSGAHPFRVVPHLAIREQERYLGKTLASSGVQDRAVWIQDDCWIGVNAVVCPGVTIGKGSVVGANAVVTRDVMPYSIVAGVPARVIGARLAWNPPSEIRADRPEDLPYVVSGCAPVAVAGGTVAIDVTDEEPLLVSLAGAGANVAVTYRSEGATSVSVCGHTTELLAGAGIVTFSDAVASGAAGSSWFELRNVSAPGAGRLLVMAVSVEPLASTKD